VPFQTAKNLDFSAMRASLSVTIGSKNQARRDASIGTGYNGCHGQRKPENTDESLHLSDFWEWKRSRTLFSELLKASNLIVRRAT
jgi:hypothetical protein